MPTSLNDDQNAFDQVMNQFGTKVSIKGTGALEYAGDYWPPRQKNTGEKINTLLYHDVDQAFAEARKVGVAYLAAKAAIAGSNEKAVAVMRRWFGDHDTTVKDWWAGAAAILGAIESFITSDIHVYYRGDRANVGKPNDYPGRSNVNLTNRDMEGYAESSTSVKNNIIGLCEDFFAKKHHRATISLTGRDSVGGVLIHELSHNICGTKDHEYSETEARSLATSHPSRAWYNADNIEYFFEDIIYS